MDRLNMSFQTVLSCSLILTQFARIFDFLMDRLNMSLQISFLCSLMVTQITRIFDFLMDRLNMPLQISLWCSFILTQITRISQSHMWSLKVLFKFTLCLEMSVTNYTKCFWHWMQVFFFLRLHSFFRYMDLLSQKNTFIEYWRPKGKINSDIESEPLLSIEIRISPQL